MSNSKYKWDDYLPKMISLYHAGLSIPKIHAEIQDKANGFTPSSRTVYLKFKSLGFPTDHERKERLSANSVLRWSSEVPAAQINTHLDTEDPSSTPHGANTIANIQASPDNQYGSTVSCDQEVDGTSPGTIDLNQDFNNFQSESGSPWAIPQPPPDVSSATTAEGYYEQQDPQMATSHQRQPELPVPWEFEQQDTIADLWPGQLRLDIGLNEISQPETQGNVIATIHEAVASPGHNVDPSSPVTDEGNQRGIPRPRLAQDKVLSLNSHATSSPNQPFSTLTGALPDNTIPSMGSQLMSLLPKLTPKLKVNRSCSPKKWITNSPRDSGYASGRNSPMVSLVDVEVAHANSLKEFKGLYRVPCILHEPQPLDPFYEPQPKGRYRNISRCAHCLYSGIHNLSWSTRYLKLEVFQAEVKLDTLYDVSALDTAGNSALHYAAAGGASFEHFLSLMQAGVNPYQLNTAGQLFLHCLRPAWTPDPESLDETSVPLFCVDLINLLNFMNAKGAAAALRWKDNKGETVVDAISPLIPNDQVKIQLKAAGYYLDTPHPFVENCYGNSETSSPGTDKNAYQTSGLDNPFNANQERQRMAWETYRRASIDPSYIDPQTGDNILHALSRIKLTEKNSLLSKIQRFVKQDVDLNLRNNNGDTPLICFVRERPFLGIEHDETGATMSKYLDALLWKDARNRIPTRINVNMQNSDGATALYYAATSARPHSVRSLIEAGANANARITGFSGKGSGISVLLAARNAKGTVPIGEPGSELRVDHFNEVLSYLEHEKAVEDPSIDEERRVGTYSLRTLAM